MNTRVKDLQFKKYGSLTVMSFAFCKEGRSYWNCVCECGIKTTVASSNLRLTKKNQCGKCKIMPTEQALSLIIMRDYKFRAWRKKLKFSVSVKRFCDLLIQPCFYCGAEKTNRKLRRNRAFQYNGIDRIDSSKGYTTDNVVTCCGACNIMKNNYTQEEFKQNVRRIFQKWASK